MSDIMNTTSDKDTIYNQCDNCKKNEPHIHYLIDENDPPECDTLDEMVEKVTAERIEDSFGRERTHEETTLNHERLKKKRLQDCTMRNVPSS